MDKQINRFKQREQAFFLIFQAQFRPVEDDDIAIYSENVEEVGDYARKASLMKLFHNIQTVGSFRVSLRLIFQY